MDPVLLSHEIFFSHIITGVILLDHYDRVALIGLNKLVFARLFALALAC